MDILYKDESYKITGAAMAVHTELGCGFLEAVYQESLEKEFCFQGIPFKKEVELPIYYRNQLLSKHYRVDFICYDKIIVELKAVSEIINDHRAQVINYLKASKLELGILFNFGKDKLYSDRIIRLHSFNSMTERNRNAEQL
ncbi:MAG: hypothetical protein Ta2A_18730 [Treponemataceae bacterium]|nr:MAG: hypothetical protein Ta2A_18730 [Treponemataceae bacterium]